MEVVLDKGYQTANFDPRRYDDYPRHFYMGFPPGSGREEEDFIHEYIEKCHGVFDLFCSKNCEKDLHVATK